MAYTVAVTWIAKPGEGDAVASALQALVEPSRAEEGVLVYIPNRDPEDPTKFFIYEQYVDEAAYTAHTETEHFQRLGFEVLALLARGQALLRFGLLRLTPALDQRNRSQARPFSAGGKLRTPLDGT